MWSKLPGMALELRVWECKFIHWNKNAFSKISSTHCDTMWTDIDRPRPRVRLTSILTYRLKQTTCRPWQMLIHQLKVNYNFTLGLRATMVYFWQERHAEWLPYHCIDKCRSTNLPSTNVQSKKHLINKHQINKNPIYKRSSDDGQMSNWQVTNQHHSII